MPEDRPYVAFRFEVRLVIDNPKTLRLTSPLCAASFAECDGLEMTMEPRVVREGGNNTEQVQLVGPVTYGSLRLKRGMTANLDLWKWFTGAAGEADRGTKASGEVLLLDSDGTPRVRFTLTGCLPVKLKAPAFNAKDGLLALEEMQINYGSFKIEAV
jgi:phage tail-like protein